jgi:hypothetical protein
VLYGRRRAVDTQHSQRRLLSIAESYRCNTKTGVSGAALLISSSVGPELVRKEIWTHILAYNLIRTIMAQAAANHGIKPRAACYCSIVSLFNAPASRP